ncbi:multidrug effflux MFS transporter [Agrobacterium rosae]|uniref:Bcr/CflA family efflux transporter n=1 Tax=Agrobacterium rosae TaxID=1972867 RepID=A0AAW9FCU3_9HYPH|nr:multidrug effflux MFS transporter [Agrobacterium rosae]MDX8304472.1 multidrug effflux MFS transporter [Agrobacterium rosae]
MAKSDTAVPERPSISVTRLTIILAALTAFAPFATDMYLASFPMLAEDFRTDLGKVQLGLSLFFLGLALGQLVYGPLIDRFGRKLPLLAGIGLFIVTSLLIVFAPNIESFIVLRLLQAIGGCAGMIVSRAIISDLFEGQEAASILSLMMLVQGLGPILAPILGGYIVAAAGWQAVFLFIAAFATVCFLATRFGIAETLPTDQRQRASAMDILRTWAGLLARPGFIVPTLAGSFAFACMFAFISGSPFVYMELHGVSETLYGWLFGLNAIGMIIAAQLNRSLLVRFPAEQVTVVALGVLLVSGVALVFVAQTASLPVLIALLWVGLATVPMIGANSTALAMAASGRDRGSASAIIGVLQFGLASMISGLVGVFHNSTAWPMTGAILLCAAAAASIWIAGRKIFG